MDKYLIDYMIIDSISDSSDDDDDAMMMMS